MGRLKLQSGIKAIEEEPEDYDMTYSNKTTLACMINSEIGAVLAVMRRNVRWGGRYMSSDDQLEHSLIQSLKALRKQIFLWQNQWHTINPAAYLQPFLDVIQSDETGAPITGVALSSVHKILTLDVIDQNTANVEEAMRLVVDSVTSCRFEVTDQASEEVVLMKILHVLLACMKSKASVMLIHQAEKKAELLQRIARHTMHELVRCIFSHLLNVENTKHALVNRSGTAKLELAENGNGSEYDDQASSASFASNSVGLVVTVREESMAVAGNGKETVPYDSLLMTEPYGVPCMVEIFHFLCTLLNTVEHVGMDPRSNTLTFDEDVPLFALGLINSAIELGGLPFVDELFRNLMQFGLSMSPLILSMVCSIVLNLYHHLRTELKLQLEAFFSCVILRLAQGKYGASYQQQEKTFMVEMYANLDCDITCRNVFEDLANLLSKSAFPVNCPLSAMHILALDRIGNGSVSSEQPRYSEEYLPFWMVKCDNYADPVHWVPFVRRRKYIKRRLMIGADHFNRDPKKGLEFLQGTHLLPDKLDPQSVACFFRYTAGLDKNLVGDFLGNHDEFCVQVLHEFAGTFDFQDMNLDTALRLFLETFRLPGESQKIQRVLEAFSERYYEQSPQILANKDAALLLSYSLIMLNTDQHNVQVKKKMTEEDFIRNNRHINGGNDLPRDFLMATVTVFTIANRYGDYIRTGWRNILDCILRLHKLGLLPARVASDAADESELSADPAHLQSIGTPRRSSGLMGRFSQLLSLDTEEPRSQPTEQQLAAHQRTLQTIQKCHIDSIFTESKFLQAESLLQLARALIWAAGQPQKGSSSPEDEDTAVFCLELLIAITLNNRDRIVLLWQGVYEHIANIVQSTVMPCALVEKAVFGLLRICQRLLPYKENLADELLRSLQLVLKLDARVADAYCEQITQEVSRLVKANATHIRSQMGWRTITSLLSITARHPEASEAANYVLCIDAARQFAESRVGQAERSARALDLMSGSVDCLARWTREAKEAMGEDDAGKMSQDIGDLWLRLVQGLRKVCLDQREEVRNHALLSLQKCLTGVDGIHISHGLWLQCFDLVIFTMLDDLLEIAQGHQKDYRNMEGTLILATKLLSKVFLQLLHELSQLTTFCKLWLGVLSRMEKYMKVKVRGKKSEKLQELVLELLKNILLVMKTRGILMQRSALGGDSLWELTWLHVNNIAPSLQSEVFPDQGPELKHGETGCAVSGETVSVPSNETTTLEGAGAGS
ncbi:hypothetical protein ERO13_D04G190951v2 [Gossypium hirsutum]|nr:hypothetical protein ERO13_D04G190951v2 [Gossypium hirsutum]KAG4153566.1 hypothetical protein ERO13_D04G190951v2 [Gossypium hirsutum]